MDRPRNKAKERKKLISQMNAVHLRLYRKNEGMDIGSSETIGLHSIITKNIGNVVYHNWIWIFLV